MKTMHIFQIIAFVAAIFASMCRCDQPSYQVSLYVKLHPKGLPIHLCNGAIIQSRLVLTTASCFHYQFSSNSPVVTIPPPMVRVVSGSSTEFSDELTRYVKDILVADGFNFTTGDNDLAILRLNKKLPLDERNDISWITLEDADIFEGPCVGNYYVRNSMTTAPNYIQSEELPLLDSEICRENSKYPHAREDDICSLYMLPLGFNCHALDAVLPNNGDRGTGLVCQNKLIGVLSTIQLVENKHELDCSDKPMKAFYTSLTPHLAWIYGVVSDEDVAMYEQGEFISSLPYSGHNDAMEDTTIIEPGSSSPLVGSIDHSSTEAMVHHSGAHKFAGGYVPILLVLMGLSLQSFAHAH